jgi:hypothetical protein
MESLLLHASGIKTLTAKHYSHKIDCNRNPYDDDSSNCPIVKEKNAKIINAEPCG